jgi:hypothetical protein
MTVKVNLEEVRRLREKMRAHFPDIERGGPIRNETLSAALTFMSEVAVLRILGSTSGFDPIRLMEHVSGELAATLGKILMKHIPGAEVDGYFGGPNRGEGN